MTPQLAGVAPLGERLADPAASTGVVKARIQTAMFEPAPMPDPDAAGPNSVIDPKGGLSPRLFSSKDEFEGDGYSYGSSQHATLDARKQPAAGLGLSVPLISGNQPPK